MTTLPYFLSELLKIKNGCDHKHLNDGVYPVYGSGGVMRYVDRYIYDRPSILLPRKGSVDHIQFVDSPFWAVDTTYFTVVDETKADIFYLYSLLGHLDLSGRRTGTGVPSMTFDSYYKLKVYLPDLSVQRKIGKFLSSIDRLIQLSRKRIEELEKMAKEIYDYWFVQFDFPDKNGKPYKSSGGKMVYNEQLKRAIPEGWEVKMLPDVADINTGKEDANFSVEGGAFPFFTCSQKPLRCAKSAFSGSAVLIAGNGEFNVKRYIGDFNAYQRTYVIQPHDPLLWAAIFYEASRMIDLFKKRSSGSIIKFITLGDVCDVRVNVPARLDLYKPIVDILSLVEKINKEMEHLTSLRDFLLPLLMNGQAKMGGAA